MTTSCPSDDDLLRLCLGHPAAKEIKSHVEACAECGCRANKIRAEVAASLDSNGAKPAPTSQESAPNSGGCAGQPGFQTLDLCHADDSKSVAALPSSGDSTVSMLVQTSRSHDENLPKDRNQPEHQSQARTPQLPTVIGRYFVRKELGSGRSGQGRVFLALHPTLERDVAIKIGHQGPRYTDSNELLIAEGRVLSQLNHPHLAKIYDLDFHDGCPYLVMEFIRGKTLTQAERHTNFTPVMIAQLLAKVSRGVAAAHARGIVHQDLKPDNIVLDEQGEPRVIDFGMARLQTAWEANLSTVGGTAQFMAPEQAVEFLSGSNSGDADPRRDVFSLGAVLYFLLTGVAPFQGDNMAACLQAATECNFDRKRLRSPNIPFHLARICLRAMAKQPGHRPASATEFAKQLELFSERRRLPAQLMLAAVATLLSIGGVWFALWYGNQKEHPNTIPLVETGNAGQSPDQSLTVQKPITEAGSTPGSTVEPILIDSSEKMSADPPERNRRLFGKDERDRRRSKKTPADDVIAPRKK